MADITKRVNYFDRQFLRAAEFQDEQAYDLDRRRRHNRLLHAPGVAEGLLVSGNVDDAFLTVSPGTAYDALGEEIVLAVSEQVSVAAIAGATAYITIAYAEHASDPSTDPGVTGNSTRISEQPGLAASATPPANPNLTIPLARVALVEGKVSGAPDNTVRNPAAAVVAPDLTLRSVTLRNDAVAASTWPKLVCSAANTAALQNGGLSMDNSREIFFADNGQIRSFDDNHRVVFNRQNNLMELHEFGDIRLMTGGASPTEKVRVTASGLVGIGTATPAATLDINNTSSTAGAYTVIFGRAIADNNFTLAAKKGVTTNNAGDEVLSLGLSYGTTTENANIRFHRGGSTTGGFLSFSTGSDSECMRISGSGNVGIGTTAPRSILEADESTQGALGPRLTLTNTGGGANAAAAVDFNTFSPSSTGTYNPSSRIEAVDDGSWANDIVFSSNNPGAPNHGLIERVRITSQGSVGIGTSAPDRPLAVQSQGGSQELVSFKDPTGATKWHINQNLGGSNPALNFVETGVADARLFLRAGGNVGIGTTTPGTRLDVAGAVHGSGFPTSSDERFKTNVAPLTDALQKIDGIRGVAFDWNELYESLGRSTRRREIGVIAQDVEKVLPELVSTWDEAGYKAVDYGRLTALLVEGIKELKAKNDALEHRIEALEKSLGETPSERAQSGAAVQRGSSRRNGNPD